MWSDKREVPEGTLGVEITLPLLGGTLRDMNSYVPTQKLRQSLAPMTDECNTQDL